jgi:hypothetical protein
VQAPARVVVAAAGEPGDGVDLLVGVLALCAQPVDGLDRPRLDRGEAVQLERLADDVEETLLDDALGREVLREAADGQDLGGLGLRGAHAGKPLR